MIDTTLAATSEKLWPSPDSTLGGPRSSFGMKRRKKASIASRPCLGAQVAARGFAALRIGSTSVWLASSKSVRSAASRSLRISIRKRCLGK